MGIFRTVTEILMVFPGLGRARYKRAVGPEEGIEDEATASSYEQVNSMLPSRLLRKLAVSRLKKMSPRGVMVDLGCGPGFFTADAAEALPKVNIIALDISKAMLERAEKHLGNRGLKNRVRFQQGDIMKLPFDDDSLDFVISTLSLHHWAKPKKAFFEIYRVLKPGGGFMVFDTRRDAPRMLCYGLKFLQRFVYPTQLREKNEPTSSIRASYRPGEALRLAAGTPFSDVRVTGGIFWLFITGEKGK